MKKTIYCAVPTSKKSKGGAKEILNLLRSKGIDTTSHKYELKAELYERYKNGGLYSVRFTTKGDYLAYFSMLIHESPSYSNLLRYFDDFDDLKDFIEENPSVDAIKEHASRSWWGDGDDYILYLRNLDEDKLLYEGDYSESKLEDEEDDWGD